jgi:hypothetical protein
VNKTRYRKILYVNTDFDESILLVGSQPAR